MERDIDIVRAVADYRVLRQDQLQQLFFGSKSTAQYRLSHLYQHGFLSRHFLPVYAGWSPTLYRIDKRGISLLKSLGVERFFSWNDESGHEFLAHTLAINDVRIAITLACKDAGYTLSTWISESELKTHYDRVSLIDAKGKKQSVALIPDSYFVVETPRGKAAFFVEMDMGTMTTVRFQTKIRAYQAYVQSGKYQERYQSKSLRVLTVTSTSTRVVNLRTTADAVNGGRLFWFSTKDAVTRNAVFYQPIWHIAGSTEAACIITSTT